MLIKNTCIEVTDLQLRWLKTRGDRGIDDVKDDIEGLYVLMGNGKGGYEKIYIPTDERYLIKLVYSKKKAGELL